MTDEATARGEARLREVFGHWEIPADLDDFMKLVVSHLYGNIWSRPGLSLQERSLLTCAVLVARGFDDELRIHLRGALNLGIEREKLLEMILHVAQYAGLPAGRGATEIAREIFQDIDGAAGVPRT